jgi:hypothetical protein
MTVLRGLIAIKFLANQLSTWNNIKFKMVYITDL